VYRAEPAGSKQASYLSRVLDGDFRARWGLYRWHGSHGLAVESRSGNTAKPDATWSGFAPLERPRATAEGGVGQIASPPGRYVQYRVTFDGPDSRLGAVTLAYLPQNQRARITELGTADSAAPAPAIGALGAAAAGASASAPPRVHQTVLKLRWKVENPDGDELTYRLAFREENESVWRPLGGPDPLTKTELDWNTEGLPDGNYVVRVSASDERSEPRERALETSFTSSPILIDNRKPEVVGLVAKLPFVSGRARDDQSPLSAMEYAIDGGDWQLLAPNDGIADDVVEAFTIKLPPLSPGPHAVTVRVWDSADNVGAAGITVRRANDGGSRRRHRRAAGRARRRADRGRAAAELLRDPVLPETRAAAIVDPAWEVDRLLQEVKRLQLRVELALITHTHNDHIEGVAELVEATGAAVVVNAREADAVRAASRTLIDAVDGGDVAIGRRGVRALVTPATRWAAPATWPTATSSPATCCSSAAAGAPTSAAATAPRCGAACSGSRASPRRRACIRGTTTVRPRHRRSGRSCRRIHICAAGRSRNFAPCANALGRADAACRPQRRRRPTRPSPPNGCSSSWSARSSSSTSSTS
jgi:hypothetical protein